MSARDRVEVEQYQFDRANNTYYELAREFRRRDGRQPRNVVYTEAEWLHVADLATMRATRKSVHASNDAGTLRVVAPVAGNGVNFLIIRPSNGGS